MGTVLIVLAVLVFICIALFLLALFKNDGADIDGQNPYLHPQAAADILPEDMVEFAENMPKGVKREKSIYESFIKRPGDLAVSFLGIVLLSPLFAALCLAIYIDDPGPVFFTQNRVGRDKKLFRLHKFRSMKMSTPHDTPTHMLENPEQYITKVGSFLRKHSLDELPQIWDIFRGKMSIIGPRPALWNQADLVNAREKYGVNSLMPGLTGLAQINGRDELEIPKKVEYDAEYAEKIGFLFDTKCFLGTVLSVIKSDGIVEGGTGSIGEECKIREEAKK